MMGLWRDEKAHGKTAREKAHSRGDGGSAKEIRKRGTVEDNATVRSTSLQNLKDAVHTFKSGR